MLDLLGPGGGAREKVERREHVRAARDRTARHAARHDLGERGEVGCDAEMGLRAARCDAKAGDDLVEDQERAVRRGQLAQRHEKRGGQRHHAERAAGRLDDRRGDLAVGGQNRPQAVDVVGVGQHHLLGHARQHAHGRSTVEMRLVAGRHVIVPAVEMRPDAQDPAPAGEAAGKPHRHQRRLGAGRGEADALGTRHQAPDGLGPAHLQRMAGAEMRAALECALDGGADLGMVVAEQQRAVAAVIVDVAVAIDVPFVSALAPLDVDAVGLEMAAVMRDAAREQVAGLGGECRRARRAVAIRGFDGQIGERRLPRRGVRSRILVQRHGSSVGRAFIYAAA